MIVICLLLIFHSFEIVRTRTSRCIFRTQVFALVKKEMHDVIDLSGPLIIVEIVGSQYFIGSYTRTYFFTR